MLVTETMMDHLANSLDIDPFVLRTQNLYKVSDCQEQQSSRSGERNIIRRGHRAVCLSVRHNTEQACNMCIYINQMHAFLAIKNKQVT